MPDLIITRIWGNMPVQAEGTVDGKPFYFRARRDFWEIEVGPEDAVERRVERDYANAGWMSQDEARQIIERELNA